MIDDRKILFDVKIALSEFDGTLMALLISTSLVRNYART